MKIEYTVRLIRGNSYMVIRKTTIEGKRIDAYNSEPDRIDEVLVYNGSPSDCYAFIKLNEEGYLTKK